VRGNIIRHRRRFNPFRLQPDIILTAVFVLPHSQQTASGPLWRRDAVRDLPKGACIMGLWQPASNRIWLPFEIGLQIEAEPLALDELILTDTEEAETEPETSARLESGGG
jgi:hypothetical protein